MRIKTSVAIWKPPLQIAKTISVDFNYALDLLLINTSFVFVTHEGKPIDSNELTSYNFELRDNSCLIKSTAYNKRRLLVGKVME